MIDLHMAGAIRGAPFHGLCKAGLLYQPDGTTPVMNPATGLQRTCTQITDRFIPYGGEYSDTLMQDWRMTCTATARVPGNPPVTRSPEEQAQDAYYGHTWLDHLPIPRSDLATYLHNKPATDNNKRRNWLLAKAVGDIWLLRATAVAFNQAGGTWTITFTGKRYGRWGGDQQTTQQVLTITGAGVPVGYQLKTYHLGWDSLAIDETEDGQHIMLGLCEWYGTGPKAPYKKLLAIVDIDLSTWPDTPTFTVVADYRDCVGWSEGTSSTTYSGSYEDPADTCQSGFYYTDVSYTLTQSRTITVWAWYTAGGGQETVVAKANFSNIGSKSVTPTGGMWDQYSESSMQYSLQIEVAGTPAWSAGVTITQQSTLSAAAHTATHTGVVVGTGDWPVNPSYPLNSQAYYNGYLDEALVCTEMPATQQSSSSAYSNDPGDYLQGFFYSIRMLKARRMLMVVQDNWPDRPSGQYAIAAAVTPGGQLETGYPPGVTTESHRFALDAEHGLAHAATPVNWV